MVMHWKTALTLVGTPKALPVLWKKARALLASSTVDSLGALEAGDAGSGATRASHML